MTRRLAAAIFAALLLSLSVIPAAGVCCVASGGNRMAAMHASMPCCAGHCGMRTDDGSRDRNVAVVSAPVQPMPHVLDAVIADAQTVADSTASVLRTVSRSGEFSPPPSILLKREFRI